MSLSKLSKLPSEALASVLNNPAIPLGRRLHLRLLSNLWADIIEDTLKKETFLVVRDGEAEYNQIWKPDDLVIRSSDPTDEFTHSLSRLFKSLTQLAINFGLEASWSAVPSLLALLDTTNLTAVKLYGFINDFKKIETFAIANAIDALPALTSLSMNGNQLGYRLLPHLGQALSRLEKFECLDDSPNLASLLSSSLNPRCTHLLLYSTVFASFPGPLLTQLSSNLTHLHLVRCGSTIFQSISQMHQLTSLTLHFSSGDLDSSLLTKLAPFSHLTEVKLFALFFSTQFALPTKETPLPTIKRLTLEIDFYKLPSPVDFRASFRAIVAWFPALAHLTLLVGKNRIPEMKASLGQVGKLSFSVEIGDAEEYVDAWFTGW